MELHFSLSNPGFYPDTDRLYYEECGTWPKDAVKLTDAEIELYWRKVPPEGMTLGSKGGRPAWVELKRVPLALVQIQALRLEAYRSESDHLKIEAEHSAIVAFADTDYTAWLAKVAEIKARYPLPA